jgi:putative ABC transport system permease protein
MGRMARPVLRLATRFTRRMRLTAWAIAFACMVLVGALVLVDGLANGVGSVAERISVGPFVYIEGDDLLASRIDPAVLEGIPSNASAVRIHGAILEVNGASFDVIVVSLEGWVAGQRIVPFPAGPDDVALDAGLQERIERATGAEPGPTGTLEVLGRRLIDVLIVGVPEDPPALFPDDWAYVRPDLLVAADPFEGGPIQAILTEEPLDADLAATLGLERLEVLGGVGFVRASAEEASIALRAVALVIAVLIGLLVYSAMSLEVHQRASEIAVLRSLGTSPRLLRSVYEVQAVLLAGAGSILGAALGVLIAYAVVSLTPLVGLPNLVILRSPLEPVLLTSAVALLAAAAAGLVPSRRAAALVRSGEARPS